MEIFLGWHKLHLRPRHFGQQGNRKCVFGGGGFWILEIKLKGWAGFGLRTLDLDLGLSIEIFKISFSALKTS